MLLLGLGTKPAHGLLLVEAAKAAAHGLLLLEAHVWSRPESHLLLLLRKAPTEALLLLLGEAHLRLAEALLLLGEASLLLLGKASLLKTWLWPKIAPEARVRSRAANLSKYICLMIPLRLLCLLEEVHDLICCGLRLLGGGGLERVDNVGLLLGLRGLVRHAGDEARWGCGRFRGKIFE